MCGGGGDRDNDGRESMARGVRDAGARWGGGESLAPKLFTLADIDHRLSVGGVALKKEAQPSEQVTRGATVTRGHSVSVRRHRKLRNRRCCSLTSQCVEKAHSAVHRQK